MRRSFAHIFLLCCLCLVSCGDRVLSAGRMSKITEDMVLADFWLKQHPELSTKADTMLVYDAVFRKHHCTFEQYDLSMNYYSRNVSKYEDIVTAARKRVQKKISACEAKQAAYCGEEGSEPQVADTSLVNVFEEVL